MHVKTVGVILLIITLLSEINAVQASYYEHPFWGPGRTGRVTRVIDGDTIIVSGVGRVQLAGIDAPNRGQRGFRASRSFVRRNVLNRRVFLNVDDLRPRDNHGRLRAMVFFVPRGRTRERNLNFELLVRRLARPVYIPPTEFDTRGWI